jgi:SEC-C motif-containing protein
MKCPCNSTVEYKDCCGLVHFSIDNAMTAEQLMRSRYSAFVLNDMLFLKESHSKNTVHTFNFKNTSKWTQSVNWIKLEIISTQNGYKESIDGFVEFKAYFRENTIIDFIHGRSRFVKENNHWVYLDEI